jgi:hypothetical protein
MAPDISLRNADARTRLATYLNDHLGGSVTGRQLAQRALQANRGNEYGIVLEDIARQIEEDVASLEMVMDRLGVKPDRVKEAMGWTFEKFGRLKLNGQLLGYSPLSRLVELEGLMLGITGKRAMWVALGSVLAGDPRLEGTDFDHLAERARDQRRTVERLRRQAALEALS